MGKKTKNQINNNPSIQAINISARVWTRGECTSREMDTVLAIEFARVIDEYREALIWCSGSDDFGPGGQAEEGFRKIRDRLIDGNGDL